MKTEHSTNEARAAWDAIAPDYDNAVTPSHFRLGEEGLSRAGLEPGMSFLDIAAGSGALSIPAARLGAKVLATDLSAVMLGRLGERAKREGLAIETRVMDGHALELDDDRFDMAGSQFGVMLFPDMPRGLREMTRVVRPGGRVLMIVFGNIREVEFFQFFTRGVQSVRPGFDGPPLDPPPLPFQLQDPKKLRDALTASGLKDVRIEAMTETMEFETGTEFWNWFVSSNPIAQAIVAGLELTDAERNTVFDVLDGLVRERAGGRAAARITSPINIGIGTK